MIYLINIMFGKNKIDDIDNNNEINNIDNKKKLKKIKIFNIFDEINILSNKLIDIPLLDLNYLKVNKKINYGGFGEIFEGKYFTENIIIKQMYDKIGLHHKYSLKKIYNNKFNNILCPEYIDINNKIIIYPIIYGQSLDFEIIKNNNFDENYIIQLFDCIKNLHKLNLIHTDIKPENFMLDSNNNIILIDVDNIIPVINNKPVIDYYYPQYGTDKYRRKLNRYIDITYDDDYWSLGITILKLYTNDFLNNNYSFYDFLNNELNIKIIELKKILLNENFNKIKFVDLFF